MLSEDSPEVDRFVGENNDNPKPIVWTAGSERVLAAVKRGKEASESIHSEVWDTFAPVQFSLDLCQLV